MSLAGYTPGGARYSLAGFGLVAPPVQLPDYLNAPLQWRENPHLSGFILGALAMYALPPFLGGVFQGAGDEFRDQLAARRRRRRRSRR